MRFLLPIFITLFISSTVNAQGPNYKQEPQLIIKSLPAIEVVSYYINETLHIKGYEGTTEIMIYDLNGKVVRDLGIIEIGKDFNFKMELPKNMIYTVRIDGDRVSERFRIISMED